MPAADGGFGCGPAAGAPADVGDLDGGRATVAAALMHDRDLADRAGGEGAVGVVRDRAEVVRDPRRAQGCPGLRRAARLEAQGGGARGGRLAVGVRDAPVMHVARWYHRRLGRLRCARQRRHHGPEGRSRDKGDTDDDDAAASSHAASFRWLTRQAARARGRSTAGGPRAPRPAARRSPHDCASLRAWAHIPPRLRGHSPSRPLSGVVPLTRAPERGRKAGAKLPLPRGASRDRAIHGVWVPRRFTKPPRCRSTTGERRSQDHCEGCEHLRTHLPLTSRRAAVAGLVNTRGRR